MLRGQANLREEMRDMARFLIDEADNNPEGPDIHIHPAIKDAVSRLWEDAYLVWASNPSRDRSTAWEKFLGAFHALYYEGFSEHRPPMRHPETMMSRVFVDALRDHIQPPQEATT